MGLRRALGGVEPHPHVNVDRSGRQRSPQILIHTLPSPRISTQMAANFLPVFAIRTRPTSCGGGGHTTKGRPTAREPVEHAKFACKFGGGGDTTKGPCLLACLSTYKTDITANHILAHIYIATLEIATGQAQLALFGFILSGYYKKTSRPQSQPVT